MKILIIKSSAFGDIIHALPVISLIKLKYPNAQISWLVKSKFAAIIQDYPDIHNIINIQQNIFVEYLTAINSTKFDYIFDLQGLLKSAIFAKLYSHKHSQIIGFDNPREYYARCIYTNTISCTRSVHIINQNIQLINKALNIIENIPSNFQYWNMPAISLESFASITTKFDITQPYIIITKQTTWQSKQWTEELWNNLLQEITIKYPQYQILITGITPDNNIIKHSNIINLTNKTTLIELQTLISQAKLCIAPDTGILHWSQAYNIPSIALMGATSPERTGIFNTYNSINISSGEVLDCMPCHKRICKYTHTKCMTNISIQQVLQGIQQLLTK